jgi:hypothetical protein
VTHPCETCGRPSPDATICPGCGYKLDAAISAIVEYQGLAYDLDVAITRQSRIGSRSGARSTETPVAFDQRASEASQHLKGVLAGWARVVAEETGAELPVDTLTGIATWLRPRVGWLRHHEAGAEAYNAIRDAVKAARRVCDRPAEKLYAGPCDECGEDLYARLEAVYVMCVNPIHEDELIWSVEERRRWLLQSAEDVLASPLEISRALTRYAQPVTPSAIRGYVHRGQLVARGERLEGSRQIPVYRLGDVLDILARQAERVSA